jgi:diacylglycerol O-acyltransferase 1
MALRRTSRKTAPLTSSDNLLKSQDLADANSLSRRNAELEEEIERLYLELDEQTNGILKRGYLHKWRDREISFASKWGLRYFTLQGHVLSYYLDDKDPRPRSTVNLSKCTIRWEGGKKNDQYHVFSIYTGGDSEADNEVGSLLLRLSSESRVEAQLWVEMLEQACDVGRRVERSQSQTGLDSPGASAGPGSSSPLSTSMLMRRSISKQSIQRSKSGSLQNDSGGDSAARPAPPAAKKAHPFPASRPIHTKSKSSPLSSDVRQGEQNYRGFFNLGLIIMVLAHVRILVDEAKKRSLVDLSSTLAASASESTLAADLRCGGMALLGWVCSVCIAFATEALAARGLADASVVYGVNVVMCLVNILLPIYSVWTSTTNSGLAMIYLLGSVVLWLKLTSYAHVNSDYRKKLAAWRQLENGVTDAAALQRTPSGVGLSIDVSSATDDNGKPASLFVDTSYSEVKDLALPVVTYPQNITAANLMYFIAVPTLCYQLNYPRSPSIRWKYVATYVSRLAVITAIVNYAVLRFITPILEHSLPFMEQRDVLGVLERLLKLSIPNTYVWLLGFYWFFHLYLNLLAELTQFGDRQFYKDWWNSRTLDAYWRNWNIPVHLWVVRHMYFPLIRRGNSKQVATFVTFLFSALLHEIIISVPFRHIGFHAFIGMMAQAPLIYVTKKLDSYFDNSYLSNALFWTIFCIIGELFQRV